jgi:hypothetical protein
VEVGALPQLLAKQHVVRSARHIRGIEHFVGSLTNEPGMVPDGTIQLLPNHEVRLARREALEQIAGGF